MLTPADRFAVRHDIAVAADGSIVISYIDGYDTAQMRIGVAVRGPSGPWRISFLSAEGSSQVARVAAGPDGTVAVGWTTPVLGADTVRLATLDASAGSARWAKRTVVSGIVAGDPTPVVEPSGAVLIIYSDSSVSGRFLASRRLLHGSLGAVRQLTATGEFTEVGAVAVTGRGRVLVGHRQLAFGLGQIGAGACCQAQIPDPHRRVSLRGGAVALPVARNQAHVASPTGQRHAGDLRGRDALVMGCCHFVFGRQIHP